eukprot:TRINITY_DN517_c0_g1_i1.p1 TRINITY_DN517_c0_g1~~TRINITY_DN517_c0_g1_i1.p1  ORF type:complete len:404 (+),score=87.90 TRINITY_DN517_c0_g1_i1:83-1213(+)
MSGYINPDEVIFALGCSQVGKSSTIGNLIVSGEHKPPTGDGDGESCTSTVSVYDTVIGTVVDSPGWADTCFAGSDEDWSRVIAHGAISQGCHRRLKVILFEALANTHRTVRNNVERLRQVLGSEVIAGAVIVCTMADLCHGERREKVLRAIRRAAEESGIQEIVLWQNEDIDDQGRREQVRRLQQALGRVQGVQPEKVRMYQQQVEDRARQRDTQVVPRAVKELYTELYVDYEEQQEQYYDVEAVTETVEVPEVEWVTLPPIFGRYDRQQRIRRTTHSVTKYVRVPKVRKVRVPVVRARQAERIKTMHVIETDDGGEGASALTAPTETSSRYPLASPRTVACSIGIGSTREVELIDVVNVQRNSNDMRDQMAGILR